MLKRTRIIVDHVAEQAIKQEKNSREFNDRIQSEITAHQKNMMERRKKFSLIRNK